MDNFRLLYDFSKTRHEDQLARNSELDQKAGVLVSFNIALIGLVGFFITEEILNSFEQQFLRYLTSTFLMLFLFFEIVAVYFFIKTLRLREFMLPLLNNKLLNTIDNDPIEKNLQDFSNTYFKCYKKNKEVLKAKTKQFETALDMLLASSLTLTFILIIFIYSKMF